VDKKLIREIEFEVRISGYIGIGDKSYPNALA
jgi:hypothetical protein